MGGVKIWDTFLFRDELDVLECRLVQMEDWPIYRHVLVEARVDHQGHPKPLVYAANKERFAPWKDRIVHVVADSLPGMAGAAPMDREAAQRDAIRAGLDGASADDWLILADVDEIPNYAAMRAVGEHRTGVLEMACCMFAVDWLWGAPLRTSTLCPAGITGPLSSVRRDTWSRGPVIPDAGHHLTWLGGRDSIAAKMDAHCHVECNPDLAAGYEDDRFYHDGANPFGRFGYQGGMIPVDVDDTWPRWVHERRCPAGWFRPRADSMTG
jgi:beta-1,4-mannosyl-glycoprotein beta-1,4-N-acetylglucosaminyltransferase